MSAEKRRARETIPGSFSLALTQHILVGAESSALPTELPSWDLRWPSPSLRLGSGGSITAAGGCIMAQAQQAPQQLSSEEARVMRECNQESFYRRCVPISAVMMAGTLYMVRTGRWRASASFGPAPKMAAAGFVGYLVGKFSYIDVCKQRLMELPDSKIGQMLRLREQQRRDGGGWQQEQQPGFLDLRSPAEQPSQQQSPQQQPWTPLPPRGEPAGLDDYYRPTVDSSDTPSVLVTDDLPTAQHTTTYDELRRQNRAEAEARLRRGAAPSAVPGAAGANPPPPPPPVAAEPAPRRPSGSTSTNKYGDSWDN